MSICVRLRQEKSLATSQQDDIEQAVTLGISNELFLTDKKPVFVAHRLAEILEST